ncbi:hypothetical protein K9L05_04045 [Candidatus Babeliales bacterium]|nr:hypothetical protein [Candidatus Babeliales bacterium]MCF7899787.1 hypothetical protein [Candidatus Babeliales bacterium]
MKSIKKIILFTILFLTILTDDIYGMMQQQSFVSNQSPIFRFICNHKISVENTNFPINISIFRLSDECYRVQARNFLSLTWDLCSDKKMDNLITYLSITYDKIREALNSGQRVFVENAINQIDSSYMHKELTKNLNTEIAANNIDLLVVNNFIIEFTKKCEFFFLEEIIKKVGFYFEDKLAEKIAKKINYIHKINYIDFKHRYNAIFPNKEIVDCLRLAVGLKLTEKVLRNRGLVLNI